VWGEIRLQGPSRFLDDLPESSVAARPKQTTPRAPAIVDGTWAGVRRRRPRASADEFDQRTNDDDVPTYRVDDDLAEPEVFRTGDQVSHSMLGVGRVVAISDGKVIVEFPGAGRKTVLPRFLQHADDGSLN